jgi:hypothetical protein
MKKALAFVARAVVVGLLIGGQNGSNLYPRLFRGILRRKATPIENLISGKETA